MQTLSPAWAQIDLNALAHNIKQVKALTKPHIKIMAVVKANAYGHGLVPASRTLLRNGADLLAVAFVQEAVELRDAGIQAPVAILSGVIKPEQTAQVVSLKLQPFVYGKETVQALASIAKELREKVKVHIKIDTGMGRLGVFPEDVLEFAKFIQQTQSLEIEGLVSHLARAEDDAKTTRKQVNKFQQAVNMLKDAGINPPRLHLANSAGIINCPEAHFNTVRPGLMLYGAYPDKNLRKKIELKPVLSLKSKIAFLKKIPTGTAIGYGHTYKVSKDSLIATIPIGYADGYNRLLSNKGEVLVREQTAPVVGRVCMDFILVDVTKVSDVQLNDEITLIGKDGDQEITVEEIAQKAGTISYEVMCSIGQRVERIYRENH